MGGERLIFAGLQWHERIRQHIGASGEEVGREQHAVIADLRLVEQPPTPALGIGRLVVELGLDVRRVWALLAGLEVAVEDLHTGGDEVFEHEVVHVGGEDQRQLGGDRLAGGQRKGSERRAGFGVRVGLAVDAVDAQALVDGLHILHRAVDVEHRVVIQAAEAVFAGDGEQVGGFGEELERHGGGERVDLNARHIAAGQRAAVEGGVEGVIGADIANADHGLVEREQGPGVIVTDVPQALGVAMSGEPAHCVRDHHVGGVELGKGIQHHRGGVDGRAARKDADAGRLPVRAGGALNGRCFEVRDQVFGALVAGV